MNETERLILENQKIMMKFLHWEIPRQTTDSIFGIKLSEQCEKTAKALALKSGEGGYEKDIEENPRHENMCGIPIKNQEDVIVINCGDDLGGDNNEFAQCNECRMRDYECSPSSKDGGLE